MFSNYPTDDAGLDYYTCVTLIDITKTDAARHYSSGMDEAEAEYNIKRNQYRNYQTMLQVIGLRCQPVYLTDPVMHSNEDLIDFGSDYTKGNIWAFSFGVEQVGIFDLPNQPTALLLNDLHNVPIITGLSENVNVKISILDTSNTNSKNTIILK